MKKCYSLLRWYLITGCAQQTFTVQNKPAVAPKETITHHFFVSWNWAEENCRCSQNLWRRRNVVKTETQQTFVNGFMVFYYFMTFILRWKRVCIAHNNCMSCPSIWATLSALLINILLGSFQLFLHSDQPLSEGEIIPFSSVCQSGGSCIIHAGGGGGFTH